MSLDSVKLYASTVIEVMRRQQGDDWVHDLESAVRNLDVPDHVETALNDLIAHCHVRALGDIHVEALSWQDWLTELDKLRQACNRELKSRGLEAWDSKRQREEGQARGRRNRAARAGPGSPSSAKVQMARDRLVQAIRSRRARIGGDRSGRAGSDRLPYLPEAVALILFAALFYAAAMILVRLPDFAPPPTATVSGVFLRSEPQSGGFVSARRGQSGTFQHHLYLRGDAIAYGVSDFGGYGWRAARGFLKKDGYVTLLVDREAHERLRDRHAKIRNTAERTSNYRFLAGRLVHEAKRSPVPILELRVGERAVFSKLRMLPRILNEFLVWSAAAAAIIFLLVVLDIHGRRRGFSDGT